MPNLRGIIQEINAKLQSGPFGTAKFQDALINNLAYLISAEVPIEGGAVERTVRPCIVGDGGECTDMTTDDTVGLQLYHRNTGLTYEDKAEDSFGEPGRFITEIAEMIIVVRGDRNRIKIVQEDLVSAMWGAIPRTLDKALTASLNLQTVDIMPGEINVDAEAVWAQEYEGTKYSLDPEDFLISIRYRITTLFSNKCFKIC